MRSFLLQVSASLAVIAACTPDSAGLSTDTDSKGGELVGQPGAAPASANAHSTPAAGPSARTFAPLPDLTPTLAKKISSPRQVPGVGPFYGAAPGIRANDRHSSSVTGKDCMTCHGAAGPAPHFAYGGTISLGSEWTWSNAKPGGGGGGKGDSDYGGDDDDDDYGEYGGGSCGGGSDYDDEYGGGGGGGSGYSDYGDYSDDSYDTGSYEDDYGYGSCGRKGAPKNRTAPSINTEIRIVGSDGYVYDTVTDADGNFWFKTKGEVAVPAYTGIHYGEFVVTGSTNGVACGSCHESGAADSPGRLWTWNGKTPR